MRRLYVLILLIPAIHLFLYPFEFTWPVKELSLTGTFGENRWGHFHSGIDLGGGEQDIYPINEGELIFAYDESDPVSGFPSGLGSFVVAEHSGGMRSLYAHLKNGSIDSANTVLHPAEALGVMGDSGGSLGVHLHLSVISADTGNIINPLLLLPPRVDISRPAITEVFLVGEENGIALESREDPIPAGQWDLWADVYDQSDDVSYFLPMAPFRVTAYIDGVEQVYVSYEYLSFSEGDYELIKSPGFTYDTFYKEETLIRLAEITLEPGERNLEITAADFFGNESVYKTSMSVE